MRRRTLIARALGSLFLDVAPGSRCMYVPPGTYIVVRGAWVRIAPLVKEA